MSDYEILGVPATATQEEIKAAYHKLARELHPDRYADNPLSYLAEEKMKEINAAYERICQERKYAKQGPAENPYAQYEKNTYDDPQPRQRYYSHTQEATANTRDSDKDNVKPLVIASILVIVGFSAIAIACKDIIYMNEVFSLLRAFIYLAASCLVMVFADKINKFRKALCILPSVYCFIWNIFPRILKILAVIGLAMSVGIQIIDPSVAHWRITIFIILLFIYAIVLYYVSDKIFERFTGHSFKEMKEKGRKEV